uniref:Nuclear receptor domain-containing protein n=1 Tax=Panagrolaimus davidi TaxID=227884 RepID=A0A914PTY7_9BILA
MPGNTPLNCLICGGISYGYHFGILACRACAAFFRRTVAENKTYKCKTNFECTVAKEDGLRNMCRACRYRKCEEFGMDKNDVQMNRDPIGKKEKQSNSPEPSSSTISTSSASSIITVNTRNQRETYTTSNPPISIIPYQNLNHLATLERLKQGYNIYRTSQKSLYKVLYPADIFSEENLQIVTHGEFVKMERGCISLLFSMINDFYLPFNQLEKDAKIMIFQNYNVRFNLLNGAFASYQKGPALPDSVFQLHYGQYMVPLNLRFVFVINLILGL